MTRRYDKAWGRHDAGEVACPICNGEGEGCPTCDWTGVVVGLVRDGILRQQQQREAGR